MELRTYRTIGLTRSSTLQHCFHGHDLHGRVIRRKPYSQTHHERQHLKDTKQHLDKPETFWKPVLWTDEVEMQFFGHNQRRYVCRGKKRAAFDEKNTTIKHLLYCGLWGNQVSSVSKPLHMLQFLFYYLIIIFHQIDIHKLSVH